MSNRALITGIQGFTGRYLADILSNSGYDVFGLAYQTKDVVIQSAKKVYCCSLTDVTKLAEVIDEVRPDLVIHLAAIAFVAHGDVNDMYFTNLIGSRNLLQVLSTAKKSVKSVLLASSANIYGNTIGGILDESCQPAPANDYAVSKLAMEYMAQLYKDKLPIIIVRPFNYTGIGQSENFLIPKIVSHIKKKANFIELGNLNVARDFSDVRNVVRYYHRLLEEPAAIGKTFNICSGVSHTLQDILSMSRSIAGYDLEVRVNPEFVRSQEVKILIGSRRHLENVVGVVPDIPFEETLTWMIN